MKGLRLHHISSDLVSFGPYRLCWYSRDDASFIIADTDRYIAVTLRVRPDGDDWLGTLTIVLTDNDSPVSRSFTDTVRSPSRRKARRALYTLSRSWIQELNQPGASHVS